MVLKLGCALEAPVKTLIARLYPQSLGFTRSGFGWKICISFFFFLFGCTPSMWKFPKLYKKSIDDSFTNRSSVV